MNRTSTSNGRRAATAIVAIAVTFAIHGGWISGMDRDAAVTYSAAAPQSAGPRSA